jgi:hypothetical protein
MAPQERQLLGTRPTTLRSNAVDERILAQRAHPSPTDVEQDGSKERRSCFYCFEGWVFLGSLDHDGAEVIDAIRCRRCNHTERIRG